MGRTAQRSRWFLAGLLGGGLLTGAALGQQSPELGVESHVEIELRAPQGVAPTPGGELRLKVVLVDSVDVELWRARLTGDDFDERERAFQDLVVRGLKDRGLFAQVQEWAGSSDLTPPELAWTARLALREMRHRVQPIRVAWVPRGGAFQGSAMRSVEAMPALPGGERALSEATPAESLRQIEVDHRMPLEATQRMSLYAPRAVSPRVVQRNVQFHVQPEGVTLLITELGPNGPREQRYAGESVQALVEEHPELRLFVPGIDNFPQRASAGIEPRGGPVFDEALEGSSRTLVLGVKCTPLPLRVAEARQLGPGVGLLIERREPGTLAEELDLRRGDILVEVAGRQVCSPAEISAALAECGGQSFQIKIVDRNGLERVHRWVSSSAPAVVTERGESLPKR